MRFVFEMLFIYIFLQNEKVFEKQVKVFPKRKYFSKRKRFHF